MNIKELMVEDILEVATKTYGVEIMGDDFIGFKFIGESSVFWNSLLQEKHDQGFDVPSRLNSEWLNSNGIPYVEYLSEVWSMY